jgi:hypothetical protein
MDVGELKKLIRKERKRSILRRVDPTVLRIFKPSPFSV